LQGPWPKPAPTSGHRKPSASDRNRLQTKTLPVQPFDFRSNRWHNRGWPKQK
jgi:hypothetical protein